MKTYNLLQALEQLRMQFSQDASSHELEFWEKQQIVDAVTTILAKSALRKLRLLNAKLEKGAKPETQGSDDNGS